MAKIRYRDAKYLCKYDLDTNFFNELSLNINDLWPTRNIFVLDCDDGRKILKMINYSDEKLSFIVKLLAYVKEKYPRVLTIHKFADDKYSVYWKENKYILLDLIEGVECNLTNPIDLGNVSKAIAQLHKAGLGALDILNENEKSNISLGGLLERFEDEKQNLIKFKFIVNIKEIKNDFDKLFLENVDYNLELMNESIELLKKSNYKEMCKNKDYICVCHNDLAYHNIMVKDEEVYFIDFDYSNVDIRVMDIYNFIIKTLKRYGFDYDIYNKIISDYSSVSKITDEEKEILYILLKYPSDFYTISKNYYLSLKKWSFESYLDKLTTKVLYKKEKANLIEKINNK